MGIERIAFLKHGVGDLRLIYDNDLRFLEQFGCGSRCSGCTTTRPRPARLRELEQRLTLTGTKVEALHTTASRPRALRRRQGPRGRAAPGRRPPARLQVDTGTAKRADRVRRANVAAGQTVAVAAPGAVMPDGTSSRSAKLRGQESNGMILAEDEVGIGTDH